MTGGVAGRSPGRKFGVIAIRGLQAAPANKHMITLYVLLSLPVPPSRHAPLSIPFLFSVLSLVFLSILYSPLARAPSSFSLALLSRPRISQQQDPCEPMARIGSTEPIRAIGPLRSRAANADPAMRTRQERA